MRRLFRIENDRYGSPPVESGTAGSVSEWYGGGYYKQSTHPQRRGKEVTTNPSHAAEAPELTLP